MSIFRFVRSCFKYTGLASIAKIEESIVCVYFISTFFFLCPNTSVSESGAVLTVIQLESGGGCFG